MEKPLLPPERTRIFIHYDALRGESRICEVCWHGAVGTLLPPRPSRPLDLFLYHAIERGEVFSTNYDRTRRSRQRATPKGKLDNAPLITRAR